ncbi:hypothetical protein ART_1124 [Arthrobacter sp. PAMC 25486]|nr:hypothetical protein ART_1124 [Arthrobacter sp. PAMC 25486]
MAELPHVGCICPAFSTDSGTTATRSGLILVLDGTDPAAYEKITKLSSEEP